MSDVHVTDAPALLTIAESAPFFRKSKSTLWRWIQDGQFPIETRVIAGQTYVRRVDLEAYLGTPIGELLLTRAS